jgi:hypothetical protein
MIWCAPDLIATAIASAVALGWGSAVDLERGECADADIVIIVSSTLHNKDAAGEAQPCGAVGLMTMCGAPIEKPCVIRIREGVTGITVPYVLNHELGHCILNTTEHRPMPSVMSGMTFGPTKDDLAEARALYSSKEAQS